MLQMVQVINPIAFEIGPFQIRWYGIIIASAIYLAVLLADKEALRKGFRKEFIVDLVFWAIPIAFIGARLYYVLFEWRSYVNHPIDVLKIWEGGIAIYGGLIAGTAATYWFCQKEGVSFLLLLDILAPIVLLAQAIGRWGNFTNQEAHGGAVTRQFLENLHLPSIIIDQMNINGVYYQPTFLYESLWSVIGVLILLALRRNKQILVGEIAASYLIWYGCGRFVIEGMRTDSLWLFGFIRISQLVSLILVIGAIVFMIMRRRNHSIPRYVSIHDPILK